jgi:hypothetical protein
MNNIKTFLLNCDVHEDYEKYIDFLTEDNCCYLIENMIKSSYLEFAYYIPEEYRTEKIYDTFVSNELFTQIFPSYDDFLECQEYS